MRAKGREGELATHVGLVIEDEEATRGGTAVEGAVMACFKVSLASSCLVPSKNGKEGRKNTTYAMSFWDMLSELLDMVDEVWEVVLVMVVMMVLEGIEEREKCRSSS